MPSSLLSPDLAALMEASEPIWPGITRIQAFGPRWQDLLENH